MSALNRRLPREFRHNLGKYLGIFFLLCLTISIVSGFLVAARSIQRVIADTRAEANLRDFSFTTQYQADDAALNHVRSLHGGIDVEEEFCSDLALTHEDQVRGRDLTARLYTGRDDMDRVTYIAGRAPQADDEIALDRNFMDENGLSLGDTVTISGHGLTIVGQVVMPDYECMERKNTDLMFDNQGFTVAMVTPAAFDELAGDAVTYRYAARFKDRDLSLKDRTSYEGDVSKSLADDGVTVTDLLDHEDDNAITFVDDDIASDQVGYEIILFLLIVISAFIFVVLTNATVEQESAIIGTLLASGYRKGELVRHYLVLPCLVGLAAAVCGNAVGYGVMVARMADLYYHSYSLPAFAAYFDPYSFVETTVVPFVLLVVVTLVGVRRKLSATPLAFLRHEVGSKSRRASLRLPERWSYVRRFRTRVFLRNAPHFAVLFLGIMLSSLLMLFGLAMLPLVHNAADQMAGTVRAEHIYTLKAPLEIDETSEQLHAAAALREIQSAEDPEEDIPARRLASLLRSASVLEGESHAYNDRGNTSHAIAHAEKFCVRSLEVPRADGSGTETVAVYGVEVGSEYWDDIDVSGGKIVVGQGLVDKLGLELGHPVTLTDKYTETDYVLAPTEVAGNAADTGIYMSRATFGELFGDVTGGDADYFNGYASDDELQLDERYVASELTPADMTRLADQMDSSMGDIMNAMLWIAIPISIILIYLLTKTVIDRSARSISYMKVFGYHDGEIDRLYLRPVTWTVVGSYVLSLPIVIWLTRVLLRMYLMSYSGNIELYIAPSVLVETLGLGIVTYLVVAAIHVLRIRRVPLALAMKAQE